MRKSPLKFRLLVACGLTLAFFRHAPLPAMDLAECLEGMADLHNPLLARFKRVYLKYKSGADNRRFIRLVEEGAPAGMVFFHVENAVLKLLNDVHFRDKELTAAVEALYTKYFLENLAAAAKDDPRLEPRLHYSDYKTTRLAFFGRVEELAPGLQAVHEKTARDFVGALREFPALRNLLGGADGIAAQPLSWHMAGIGATPEAASAAARVARYRFRADQEYTAPLNFHGDSVQRELGEGVGRLSIMRSELQTRLEAVFGPDSMVLVSPEAGWREKVLSPDAIDLVKRHNDEPDAIFLVRARADFELRFGRVDPRKRTQFEAALLAARDYYRLIDYFSPSIYEKTETMDMGIASAKHGMVSVDLAGQGVRNTHQLMLALARASHDPLPDGMSRADYAVMLARRGQDTASRAFERRRALFAAAIHRLGLPGEIRFSGDDGMFLPTRPLTAEEKSLLASELARIGEPGDYRLAFLPSQFNDKASNIPRRRRAAFIALGEFLEKRLRIELERDRVPLARLRGMLFAIDVVPDSTGRARVNVMLGGEHNERDIDAIRAALRELLPETMDLGTITPSAPPPPRTAPVPGAFLDPAVFWKKLHSPLEVFPLLS